LDKKRNRNAQKQAFFNTTRSFKKSLPILMGVLMLLALADALVPKQTYRLIFSGNWFYDPLMGAALGSITGGNPLTSYIIGGELRQEGVSMLAITAFIISWVTVGIIQLPAEMLMLGKKFAVVRNAVSFCTSIAIAIVTVLTLGVNYPDLPIRAFWEVTNRNLSAADA
jgi:uncharacterized membrane protein YraQ (UPF0718 family)